MDNREDQRNIGASTIDRSQVVNSSSDVKFFLTERKAKIANNCLIKLPSNVIVASAVLASKVVIRADLGTVRIEAYSIICDQVVLRPPLSKNREFTSITIGRYSIIGENSTIKASVIGNCVRIGRNCILEDNVVVESNAVILDNSIVSEDTLVPKGCVFGGKPARFIKRIPETIVNDHIKEAIQFYNSVDVIKK